MLSLDYLRFLFKKNKFLILFILFTNLIICMSKSDSYIAIDIKTYLSFILLLALTYILPCINFSYIHNKRAVDSYFALPISRSKTLISDLLFIILIIFVPYAIGQSINGILADHISLNDTLYYLLVGLIAAVVLVIYNSLIYSLANNIFDGIVMIAAYNILPLAIYLVCFIFNSVYVAGYSNMPLSFTNYLSPVASCVCLFLSKIFNDQYLYLLALIIYGFVSFIILYKTYVNRKCERAESISNELFAYPFIIYAFTSLVIFGISSNFSLHQEFIDFLVENISLYLVTFVLFVIAHFVYKRKFYFNIKLPLYFLSVLVICMIFISAARNNKGFNIAYKYPEIDGNTQLKFNIDCYEDSQILEWFNEELDKNIDNLYINISADISYDSKINKATSDIIDKYRKYMIDEFYQTGIKEDTSGDYASLSISHNDSNKNYYYYSSTLSITVDELKTLAKDNLVSINISDYENDYTIDENGKLVTHVWVY